MPDVLIEDELKELLAKCENIVPEENYVVDECTKERDKEFELAKKSGVDLSQYESNEYTGFQLHEIRLGLADGLPADLYANLICSRTDMHRKRTELFAEKYYLDPQSFGRKITDAETGAVIRYGEDLLSAYVTLSKDNKLSKNAIYAMLEDNDIEYGLIDENIELLAEKGSEAGGVYAGYAAATTRNMTEADIPMV